jgi:hypothetical protein
MRCFFVTSLAQTRVQAIDRRYDTITALLKAGRPTSAIAEIVGLNYEHCKDLISDIRRAEGLPVSHNKSNGAPVGVTEESHHLRAKLGDMLYKLGETHHAVDLAGITGVPPQSQTKAAQRPFHFNWAIGQIERLARASGMSFREAMFKCLLTTEEYKVVTKWIKI